MLMGVRTAPGQTEFTRMRCGATYLLTDPATFEFADGFTGAQELAGEIHIEDELPVGQRHLVNGGVLLQTGVVDKNVNGAELLNHLLEHRLHVLFLSDIGLVRESIAAAIADVLYDFLGSLRTRNII